MQPSFRYYISLALEGAIIEALRARLSRIKAHSFTVLDIKPYHKDGGAFVAFDFTASDPEDALKTIEAEVREEAKRHGGLPSWLGTRGRAWLVRGQPWMEVIFFWRISICRTDWLGHGTVFTSSPWNCIPGP